MWAGACDASLTGWSQAQANRTATPFACASSLAFWCIAEGVGRTRHLYVGSGGGCLDQPAGGSCLTEGSEESEEFSVLQIKQTISGLQTQRHLAPGIVKEGRECGGSSSPEHVTKFAEGLECVLPEVDGVVAAGASGICTVFSPGP